MWAWADVHGSSPASSGDEAEDNIDSEGPDERSQGTDASHRQLSASLSSGPPSGGGRPQRAGPSFRDGSGVRRGSSFADLPRRGSSAMRALEPDQPQQQQRTSGEGSDGHRLLEDGNSGSLRSSGPHPGPALKALQLGEGPERAGSWASPRLAVVTPPQTHAGFAAGSRGAPDQAPDDRDPDWDAPLPPRTVFARKGKHPDALVRLFWPSFACMSMLYSLPHSFDPCTICSSKL